MWRREDFFLVMFIMLINPSLVWWGTPGSCSNRGEILKHPGGIICELKQRHISNLPKVPLERLKLS